MYYLKTTCTQCFHFIFSLCLVYIQQPIYLTVGFTTGLMVIIAHKCTLCTFFLTSNSHFLESLSRSNLKRPTYLINHEFSEDNLL